MFCEKRRDILHKPRNIEHQTTPHRHQNTHAVASTFAISMENGFVFVLVTDVAGGFGGSNVVFILLRM